MWEEFWRQVVWEAFVFQDERENEREKTKEDLLLRAVTKQNTNDFYWIARRLRKRRRRMRSGRFKEDV